MSRTLQHWRHIALTVEQSGAAAYSWLLIESAGGRVSVLKKPDRTWSTYMGALDAGYQELARFSAREMQDQEGGSTAIDNRELLDAL